MNKNTYGIYFIKVFDTIIYIGIDKHISNGNRIKQHVMSFRANKSSINKYISNNTNWTYQEFCLNLSRQSARTLEKSLIRMFKPIHNKQHKEEKKWKGEQWT